VSFLTAPQPGQYTFPAYADENAFAGVLALSELEPQAGVYKTPADWPPPLSTFERGGHELALNGLGRHGRGRGRRLPRQVRMRLRALRQQLKAQGLSKAQIRAQVRLAKRQLLSLPPSGPAHRPPPALPGSAAARGHVQGSFVAPGQLPQAHTTPATLADEPQSFILGEQGLGAQMSPQAYARLMALRRQAAGLARKYVAPSTAKGGTHEGGAQMYVDPTSQLQSSYVTGKIQLQPICDEKGQCIAYVEPEHVQKMIAQKVQGQSALGTGQMNLPGFYQHPTLGPWGVNPAQAYQYWAAQQAAMQAGAFATPVHAPIWGSPGMSTAAPQLPSSPGASSSFAAVPGQATERF
jgi:hypothetical protein